MKNITFFDWTVYVEEHAMAIVDQEAKKMVIMEKNFELHGVFWIDELKVLQMKPTWDCVLSVDSAKKN